MRDDRKWTRAALLVLGLALVLCLTVRLHRLDLPLERDEGEYAYGAQLILDGDFSYANLRTLKLPGVALVVSPFFALLGETPEALHVALLVFDLASAVALFFLARRWLGPLTSACAVLAFVVMQASLSVLGLFAHAENFALAPALFGLLVVLRASERGSLVGLFAGGVLEGVAFLMKQPAATFALLALAAVWLIARGRGSSTILARAAAYVCGTVLPYGLVCAWMNAIGGFGEFWFETVTYARAYSAPVTLSDAQILVGGQVASWWATQPALFLLAIIGLAGLFVRRELRPASRAWALLFLAGAVAASLGSYFRAHYFVFLLPALAVLVACGAESIRAWLRAPRGVHELAQAVIVVLAVAASAWMERGFLWLVDSSSASVGIYHPNPFAASAGIAELVRANTRPSDTVAVLGSEPQIPFLADRRSATGFVYMYPLFELQPYARAMQDIAIAEIEARKPRVLVEVRVEYSWLIIPGSDPFFRRWATKYADEHYSPLATFELFAPGESVPTHPPPDGRPRTESYVTVHVRKDGH